VAPVLPRIEEFKVMFIILAPRPGPSQAGHMIEYQTTENLGLEPVKRRSTATSRFPTRSPILHRFTLPVSSLTSQFRVVICDSYCMRDVELAFVM